MRDRLRYLIARIIDRIPGTCGYTTWRWANRQGARWPVARGTTDCRALAVRHGWCPCGKTVGPDAVELGVAMRRHPAGRARGGDRRA